jgi:riboflavin kinase/FMN adenylyltransferase
LDTLQRRRAGPGKAVVTIGAFDGIHLGHRRILDEVVLVARGIGARAAVVTFDPHPAMVFRPDEPPMMLATLEERLALIAGAGIDETVVLEFTRGLARRRADWFTRRILVERLSLARLVIGYDFRLGREREGDAAYLEVLGEEIGFGVDIVPPVKWAGHPISSTRVRTALARGDVKVAARMLGRPYGLRGKVVRGEGRGRRLEYPTANLAVDDSRKMLPRPGIYAARVALGRTVCGGALYVGTKPTYGGGPVTVEVYLIGARANLYGRKLDVTFVDRLRDERNFKSDGALKRAIASDVRRAIRVLGN